MADHLHQLVVTGGYRGHAAAGTIGEFSEDLVAAVDMDVVDLRIIDQRLEPAKTEDGVEDCLGDVVSVLVIPFADFTFSSQQGAFSLRDDTADDGSCPAVTFFFGVAAEDVWVAAESLGD